MIETRDLTKKYGELFAIKSIDLNLVRGDLFGFIGPNGSGKTTTMRILATLLQPTWGEAYVGGHSIYTKPKEIRRLIGYMPDFFGVYDDMKVMEYLEFFAAAYRIRGPKRRQICEEVLELVELGYKREALVTSLSRGMTQRLGLARVLLHDPQVLLLDEPASEAAAAEWLSGHALVDKVDTGEHHLTVTLANGHAEFGDLATALVAAGHKLTLLREEELNLETAFMALTKGVTS
jgi:ABC-type Na+ transport system ATPase subunit NatA